MAIAAELPDIDTVWGLRGPVEAFQHHRGTTHTLVGVPVEAALLVGAVWAWHRWRKPGVREQGSAARRDGGPPVRWGVLYGWAVVALLSHLLLDYTNNYGLRPFYPFDGRWYAASIVFIVDPVILVLLAGALVLPALFGLVGAEVGARRPRFRGRGWAVAALLGMVGWWALRAVEHGRAAGMAAGLSVAVPVRAAAGGTQIPYGDVNQRGNGKDAAQADVAPDDPVALLTPQRVWMSPHPLSPFLWSGVVDLGPAYQLAEVDVRRGTVAAEERLLDKPVQDGAVRAAAASRLGRAYLDWSPMPLLTAQAAADGGTVVTLRDPRFLGGFLAERGRTALAGTVVLDAQGRVVEQAMDGRVERAR
jgi:inner membrane protein